MQLRPSSSTLRHQRGASALIVTMLLLFTSSIVVFYLNRGLIFEQKISANQVRSTTAFEVAEAGLEWATGMLNTPNDINPTTCQPVLTTSNLPFRTKYIQTGATSNVQSNTRTFPGCKIVPAPVDPVTLLPTGPATASCACPNVAGVGAEAVAAPPDTTARPSFTVAFSDVGDPQAVRVTSTGCTAPTAGTAMCKPSTTLVAGGTSATTGNSDAWAQVSVILKLRPLLRAAPSAALTCGTTCALSGNYRVHNTEVASNGYTVNSGAATAGCDASHCFTIPGQPWQNGVVQNDSSLAALSSSDPTCSASAMFQTYMGITMAEYAASPQVMTIQDTACSPGVANCRYGNNGPGRGDRAVEAYADGWRNFYVPQGLTLNASSGSLGAAGAGNGVNLVSPGGINIDINGNILVYGLIFANTSNFTDLGTGNADIHGAIVTCAAYNNTGNGDLFYNSNALGGAGLRPGVMVRVPGSWRDFTP